MSPIHTMTKSPFIGAAACTFRKAGIILYAFLTCLVKAQTPGTVETGFRIDSNGVIMGTAVQPDGKILVFGTFTTLGGVTRPRLARLNADGSLESMATFNLGSGISGGIGGVQNVVVQNDGKILITGDFTVVNGQSRNRIARLNPDGSLESTLTFNPGAGADGQINAVAVQPDGKILLGGNFTAINGLPRNRIARLLPDGAVESTATFNPGTGVGANASPGVVYCVLLQPDGRIFIAGAFDKVNDLARKNIARLNADGSVESTATFNAGTGTGGVMMSCALQPDGGILLGAPGSVNGQSRPNLARLLPNGTLDNLNFNPNAGGDGVNSLTLQADGRILISGTFDTVGGLASKRIARVLPDGNVDGTFTFNNGPADPGNIISVSLQADGKVLFSNGYYLSRCANDSATQRLSNPGNTQIKWERGGACPELEQVTFDLSTNAGTNWSPLGAGTRIQGGWLYTGASLPQAGLIRGRGRTMSGHHNGARGMVEAVSPILVQAIRIQGTQTYTENFNSLGTVNAPWTDNFPLPGWYAQIFNGVTPVGTIKASDGSVETSGVLNLGASGASDRALGSAVTGVGLMANAAVGVLFQNTGTTPVKLSEVSYAGELWRGNTLSNPEKYTLFYQISATPVTSLLSGGTSATPDPGEGYTALGAAANWTSVAGTPFTALDGNATAFRSTITFDATAVIPVIPAGHYCMLKWTDTNEAGTDGFQAIDDVRIRFIEYPCSLSAQVSSVARQQNGPGLADDTFTFGVTVSQTNASAAWNANAVASDGAQTGAYGVVKSFGPYPVSQSPKMIVFTDSADAACTVSATGTAPVYNPVNITSQPVAVSVVQGQSASFSVTATGTAVTYQWKKGNDPIGGATGPTYTIPVTQYTDAGSYSVVVSNDAGSVPSNAAALTVREPDKAPASLGGRTIHLAISGGSYPFASSGAFRFLPSMTDDAFAIVPVSGETLPSEGTHTYSKTAANTARLSLNSTVAGPVIATCNFTTPTTGTFSLYSEWYGGSQSGTFYLFSGPSPGSVSGAKITVNITSGISPFSSSGSYRLEPAVTGNTYTLKALSGSVVDSHGTYSYYKNSANTALVDFVDSETGPCLGSQLSFETATTGTLALREANSDSYQTGLFTM
ncbi:MAG TPA: PKD domain-containing protein, partial [Verrucomicrobiales bacterium]|nr:PKD domain-containing protein [Verrucomicrobiales bacterium]